MTKQKKQFSPHVYAECGELFEFLTVEQKAEVLMAIVKYPEYQPVNVPVWNFINSQIKKDYESFIDKCNKNGEISRNYWKQKMSNDNKKISNDTERLPSDTERHPKLITNNELQITNNEITKNKQKEKIKKIDPYSSNEVNEFIKEYSKYNNNCRILNQTRLKIAQAIEINGLEAILEVIKKSAGKGHLINNEFIPLSINNMLDNAQKILDDSYNLVDRQQNGVINENTSDDDIYNMIYGDI